MAYDRDRYDRDWNDRDRFDRDREERQRHGRDDRGFMDRAGDEVRSWFGDDEAERRRRMDERERERYGREERWRGGDYRSERSYAGTERPQWGDRDRGQEGFRSEGHRDYGDRYGRPYSASMDREREPSRRYGRASYSETDTRSTGYTGASGALSGSTFGAGSGSQEYGREGYGSSGGLGTGRRNYGREWGSSESWRVPGPHAGRGPRGYQRSDERIREELNDRLTAHGLIDATDVQCQIQNGEVTLTGFVDSREAKRAAEDLAEDISGVRDVTNNLKVRSHAEGEGVGRTNVLGLTERETQTASSETSRPPRGRS